MTPRMCAVFSVSSEAATNIGAGKPISKSRKNPLKI
jgi:hypothetical protein